MQNFNFLTLIFAISISCLSFAQWDESPPKLTTPSTLTSKIFKPQKLTSGLSGFRTGFFIPINSQTELKIKASNNGQPAGAFDANDKTEAFGFSVGFVDLPVRQMGWATQLVYIDNDNNFNNVAIDTQLLRLEGNFGTSVDQRIYILGGANMSKLVGGTKDIEDDVNKVDFGFQLGAGYKMTQNLALDARYVLMKQGGSIREKGSPVALNVEVEQSGIEAGITGTF